MDTLTGEWKLLRADVLHDVGRSLNPAVDIGQVEGAFIQGMGWLTMEELVCIPRRACSPRTRRAPTRSRPPTTARPSSTSRCSTTRTWRTASTAARRRRTALLLPFSVFLAIRDAVSALGDHRVDPPLRAPATGEAIMDAVDAVRRGPANEAAA